MRRLQRLEKVRALARQAAAREAAQAEGTLAQLEALAARTSTLAEDYRGRTALTDGLDLHQLGAFVSGLTGISATTLGDAEQARQVADYKQQELALAERRRAAVEDRVRTGQRLLGQRQQVPSLGARRAVGTDLE
ncbi:MAG: hypothetical protein ACKOPE_11735 [Novosphingobium sp.]